MYFVVPAYQRVKIKENENRDKYLNHAKELKEPWNIRVTVILIAVIALRTVLKNLEMRLGELGIR